MLLFPSLIKYDILKLSVCSAWYPGKKTANRKGGEGMTEMLL